MLSRFFSELRAGGVPVSLREFLLLHEALAQRLAGGSPEEFYYLARTCLVKDERHYDRFDRVFAEHFAGAERACKRLDALLPPEWLRAAGELTLTEAERAEIAARGGWERLLAALRERLAEQRRRHEGGGHWIGTAGTSAFGNHGDGPDGMRLGGDAGGRRGAQVWERREYRNFDDTVELDTRNLKLALRRLRRFAREGAPEELDLSGTIDATARNAGLLDLKLIPERHNAVRVLLFLDVGGSMDEHVRHCERLFSAARSEFKHLEHFYFHNCPYEGVWQDNRLRLAARVPTLQVLRTYGRAYRVIFVGDAAMSPYEITEVGGSIEHHNAEAGSVWLARIAAAFPHLVWLNPADPRRWLYSASTRIIRELLGERMYPLSIDGLDRAMAELKRGVAPAMTSRASS